MKVSKRSKNLNQSLKRNKMSENDEIKRFTPAKKASVDSVVEFDPKKTGQTIHRSLDGIENFKKGTPRPKK